MRAQKRKDPKKKKAEKIAMAFLRTPVSLIVFTIGLTACIFQLGHMAHDDRIAGKLIAEFEEDRPAFPLPEKAETGSPEDRYNNMEGTETPGQQGAAIQDMQIRPAYTNVASPVADAAGYIRIAGTGISYPVMHSEEEGYYLDHAADGTKNRNGAIYLSTENSSDFSDPVNYIFGHNMTSGLMFRHLNDYLKPGYMESHKEIELVVDGVLHRYTIFHAGSISSDLELPVYGQDALGSDTYKEYTGLLSAQTGYELGENDRIIVLVTCTTGHRKNRTVVYGVSRE